MSLLTLSLIARKHHDKVFFFSEVYSFTAWLEKVILLLEQNLAGVIFFENEKHSDSHRPVRY